MTLNEYIQHLQAQRDEIKEENEVLRRALSKLANDYLEDAETPIPCPKKTPTEIFNCEKVISCRACLVQKYIKKARTEG